MTLILKILYFDSHIDNYWEKNLRLSWDLNLRSPVLRTDVMGGSPGELSEELVTQEKGKKGWGMNCDVSKATEELENEL